MLPRASCACASPRRGRIIERGRCYDVLEHRCVSLARQIRGFPWIRRRDSDRGPSHAGNERPRVGLGEPHSEVASRLRRKPHTSPTLDCSTQRSLAGTAARNVADFTTYPEGRPSLDAQRLTSPVWLNLAVECRERQRHAFEPPARRRGSQLRKAESAAAAARTGNVTSAPFGAVRR